MFAPGTRRERDHARRENSWQSGAEDQPHHENLQDRF
jgi:hypothetical protein